MASSARIKPVIMSGGSGTRLWPMSRKARPKQFLPLVTEKTMLQETAARVSDDGDRFAPPAAICGAAHADHIVNQLAAIDIAPSAVVTEPAPRNTAAVAAVAAALVGEEDPDALVLLTPADHHVSDPEGFRRAVLEGAPAAANGAIVTFGIQPTEPHTGFGYIETGESAGPGVYSIASFREKPDRATAESYLATKRYYWNAGIFLFSPAAMRREMATHAPEILEKATAAYASASRDGVRVDLDPDLFAQCPSDSIDYAVMEKTAHAAIVAPVDVGWNDIGSWTALEAGGDDPQIIAIDCDGSTIRSDGPLVGAVGLKDMIVVATADAILVAPRDRAQEVKKIVEQLQKTGRDELL